MPPDSTHRLAQAKYYVNIESQNIDDKLDTNHNI